MPTNPAVANRKHYQHITVIRAPLEKVAGFHRDATSMAAITPPPIIVQMRAAPPRLNEGDKMAFTLWLGPFPIHWVAQIEEVGPAGFVDRQLEGPFDYWVHRHAFSPIDEKTTRLVDEVTYALSSNFFWRQIGRGMALNLPLLFAYRGWKLKRLLEQG